MSTTTDLKFTSLYEEHQKLGARMVPFGGWSMPVLYNGILAEHDQTRKGATLFDISHMGEFVIKGDLKKSGLDRIVTMSLEDMPIKSCRYGMMLNDEGGVIDDLIVFRIDEAEWFIVVNAATTEKDVKNFQKHLTDDCIFEDVSQSLGKLDIQGPGSRTALSALVPELNRLDYYTFDFFDLLDENVLISRTGYTGELGYEIYYPWEKTKKLWQTLLKDDNVKPAGLGARDVLRLEVGYSLYGHEITESISPLESGLTRFIDFDKSFIGSEKLCNQRDQGLQRKLVGFISDTRRSPRSENKIYSKSKDEIGEVTSGTFSPCLNKGIGLGFVPADFQEKEILIGTDKNQFATCISGRNFYKNGSLKS